MKLYLFKIKENTKNMWIIKDISDDRDSKKLEKSMSNKNQY
jgi:hypothetical protein